MKKIISIVIVLALLLSMSCITAFASTGPFDPKDTIYPGASLGFTDYETGSSDRILSYNRESKTFVINSDIEGASYDLSTNTLTLTDFDHPVWELYGSMMGDDFTINVVGTCYLMDINLVCFIDAHTAGLTITGTGTLNVNENKDMTSAVSVYSTGKSESAVSIENGVAVNLYGRNAVYLSGTLIQDKDKAITAGGKPIDGVSGGEITYEESDTERIILYNTVKEGNDQGYLLKSKKDPEGIYTTISYDDEYYWVYRFIYYPAFDDYCRDLSFETEYLSKDELLEKYSFVPESLPTEVYYFTQKLYNERGYHGYKMTSEEDPDGVYVGIDYWMWYNEDHDNPDGYRIYRVYWDEEEEYYVEDESFEPAEYLMEELDESPYSLVTQKVEKNVELSCWVMPPTAENEEDNYKNSYEVVEYSEDPDTLYICEPYWDSSDFDKAPEGYYIYPVYVDQDTGDYYIDSYHFDSETDFHFTCDEFASSGFSFVTGIFDEYVDCHFLGMYYEPSYYARRAILLSKTDDKDTVYGYDPNNIFIGSDEKERYRVYRLDTYNEKQDFWFADDESAVWMSIDEMEAADFKVEYSDQNVNYYTDGELTFDSAEIYTDDSGVRYAFSYWSGLYRIDEDNTIVDYDGDVYYMTEPCNELSVNDLNDTIKTIYTGSYYYQLEGDFHYPAGSEPGEGFTVSGKVNSFETSNTASDEITLTLTGSDVNYTDTVTVTAEGYDSKKSNITDFAFEDVPEGTYVLSVSKENHVTREYEVTVNSETEALDVKICPKGDANLNGRVQSNDAMAVYKHAQASDPANMITDPYALKCADVKGTNGRVQSNDAMEIYKQAQGQHSLF